jgi:hypothetical protein
MDKVCIVILTSFIVLSIITIPISYPWHEELGISDERAVELYASNPSDPKIEGWKSGIQKLIDFSISLCYESTNTPSQEDCDKIMSVPAEKCSKHPNILIACEDKRIPKK